jgi:hypothetical protein
MAKDRKDVSASRRGFFRELLASGIDALEQAGKAMAERAGVKPEPPPYQPPKWTQDPYWQQWDTNSRKFGPPWPPRFGPDIPPQLRAKLKDIGRGGED